MTRGSAMILRAVFGVVVLLAAGCRMPAVTSLRSRPCTGVPLDGAITLLSWNAQKAQHPEWRADLGQLLQDRVPDLVFLQEAAEGVYSDAGPEADVRFGGSWRYPWPGGKTVGVVIASRAPMEHVRVVQSRGREFYVTAPKSSIVAEVPLAGGKSLLAVNVHMMNFERWTPQRFSEQLGALAAEIDAHDGPVLIAGDFNTWNSKRLTLVREMATALGLQELTGLRGNPKTGDQHVAWVNALLGVESELALDRVFFRGLEALDAEVLPLNSSDHPPLLVQFRINA